MPLSPADAGVILPSTTRSWDERDVMLYALAVGAGSDDLHLVYEGVGLQALPTLAVVLGLDCASGMADLLDFDRTTALHGGQRLTMHSHVPTTGTATTSGRTTHVWDKGKGAVIVSETETHLADGTPLCSNEITAFIRGGGGFGGERGPGVTAEPLPSRSPDAVIRTATRPDQALLYRLLGDRNPIHADPVAARAAGLTGPILHGLCTFGIVGRVALEVFGDRLPQALAEYEVRFAGVVYPGETITTSFWDEGDTVRFTSSTEERSDLVLDAGRVVLSTPLAGNRP